MFLTTAFAVATVLFQEPHTHDHDQAEHTHQEDPVHTAYKKALAPYREAAALHLNGTLEIHINSAAFDQTAAADAVKMEKIGTLASTVKWAKPHYGSLKVQGMIDFLGFEQKVDVESMGLEDGVYILDHDAKMIDGPHPLGEVSDPMVDLQPFRSFIFGKTEVPNGLKQLKADDAHAGMQGWNWESDQGQVECWMKDGIPASMKIEMKEGGRLMQRMVLGFSKVELAKEVDAKSYLGKLPKDYSTMDELEAEDGEAGGIDASLLAVGVEAPDVKLTDMNDQEVSLASLEGKTVLLNFWFYH